SEKSYANVPSVRIRDRQHCIASDHEFVPTPRMRAVEAKTPQRGDKGSPGHRSPRGHQLAFLTETVTPPSGGTTSPRATRPGTHPSMTSASWSRQASSVAAVASTPLSPGTVAQNTPGSGWV